MVIVTTDHVYLQAYDNKNADEHPGGAAAASSLVMLVMAETKCDSVWSYALDGTGVVSTGWVAKKIVGDLETIGLSE